MTRYVSWLRRISLVVFTCFLITATWVSMVYSQASPIVYGRVGPGPTYPDSGTVTYIAYLEKGGETDNQILTEDNRNSDLGRDQGYNGRFFYVDTENFSPLPADGDTLFILFTGIGTGYSGSIMGTVDTDSSSQNFGNSTWGTSLNPAVPTGLSGYASPPGVVHLSWNAPKNAITYRLYRSSQGSGAGNYASNGRYTRIAQDLSGPTYQDNTAPLDTCWYILVADDGTNLSGHCDEVLVDAALPVQLTSFTATGGEGVVTLEWTTESEWDNQGFHIYRREDSNREFSRINPELIPGAGNSSQPKAYIWEDQRVENGQTYWYRLVSVDFQGGTQRYGPVSATPMEIQPDNDALPKTCRLFPNYPNPFNPETWICYQLPEMSPVTIEIYNVRGQLVTTLVDEEQPPGYYRVCWDGRDLHGTPTATGVYLCQMQSDQLNTTLKMILLK